MDSNSAISVNAIGSGSVPAQLGARRDVFLDGILASLACVDERPSRGAFFIGGDGAVHVTGLRIGIAEQVVVDRIGAGGKLHGLSQFGAGVLVFLVVHVEQAQAAVAQRQLVILGLLEGG